MNQYPPQESELAATKGSTQDHPDMLSDFGFMVAVVGMMVDLVGVGIAIGMAWARYVS